MLLRFVLVVLMIVAGVSPAWAQLVQTVPTASSGSGVGAVNTVLSVQRTPSEEGCVSWNGTSDVIGGAGCPPTSGVDGGDEKTGASLTQTRSLAQLGITNAADLRIVLNSTEPNGDSITLVRLVVTIYDAVTGAALFSSSLPAPITFANSNTGTGTSGFVFRMSDAEALVAQPFFANSANRVGLAVELSSSAGGNETLYVVNAPSIVLCPVISFSPTTVPNGTIGVSYSQQYTGSGGTAPYTFSLLAGTLPPGLTLSSAGALSGVPATGSAGTYNFTVRGMDANTCAVDQGYTIVVLCPSISISPAVIPNVAVGSSYSQQLTGGGGTGPYTFTLVSGTLPSAVTLSSSGLLSGVPAAGTEGTHSFRVRATDASGCTREQDYQLTVAAAGTCPVISLSALTVPSTTIGTSFSEQLTASGGVGPYTFTLVSGTLPSAVTLSSSGLLSGVPAAGTQGTHSFRVRATDANGCTREQEYTLTVAATATCPAISVSALTNPSATIGTSFSQQLTASGGVAPYTFTVLSGALPSALTLSSSGLLSGVPAAGTDGTYSFSIRATDANGCHQDRSYSFIVAASVPVMPLPAFVALVLLLITAGAFALQRRGGLAG